MKLSRTTLAKLEPPDKGYRIHWDDRTRGLGVRVTASGVCSFVYQRRVNGRDRRLTIGRVGDLTVEQARKRAERLAGEIADGKDPVAERSRRRLKSITLGSAMDDYLDARPLKASTVVNVRTTLRALDDWMGRPLTGITRDMVGKRHRKIGEKSEALANLTMRYLRAILNYAAAEYVDDEGRPLLADNPVKKISATRSWYRVERRRTVVKPHELRPWMAAVMSLAEVPEREPGTGRENPKLRHGELSRDYFMLVLLTGLRRGEALGLRWADVDLDGRTLTVQDTKNREPHTLPLSDHLYDLLKAGRKRAGPEFVFSTPDGARLSNLRYAQNRVVEASGVTFTPHDLRRTFATVAESLDIPAYAVKALLNHKMANDVTAGYVVVTVERLRKPMQRITDYMLKAGGLRESAEVVELPNAREQL